MTRSFASISERMSGTDRTETDNSSPSMRSLLKEGEMLLNKNGVPEAGLDAWLLLEYVTGISRAHYFAYPEETVTEEKKGKYLQLIQKRAERIPLQHLTHQAFFMGEEFYVDEHVLIPRQDTEILVEAALDAAESMEAPDILDMCTGSGCILISFLLYKKGSTGIGADISPEALRIAKKNAERLGAEARAEFVESDLFSAPCFQKKSGKERRKYDMIISNPPYIPAGEIEGLMEEVRLHDPRIALDGKADGLYFYREITGKAGAYLKPGGYLFYETGADQGSIVADILRENGFVEVSVKKDLAGLPRVVQGRMREEV